MARALVLLARPAARRLCGCSPGPFLRRTASGAAGLWLSSLHPAAATQITELRSPDGHNAIRVHLHTSGSLHYDVARRGRTVLGSSPLGLIRDDQSFTSNLTLARVDPVERRQETYHLLAGVLPHVDQPHHRQRLVLHNEHGTPLLLELDAGNEGVAFRYHFEPAGNAPHIIRQERSGFQLPGDTRGWLQPYNASDSSSPAYEDYYFPVRPGDPPPFSRGGPTRGWYLPALFEVPSANAWVLIAESGTDGSYCGCHLAADSRDGIYRIEFPFPDEGTQGIRHRPDTDPRFRGPWSSPWRVIALADRAGDLITSTLITDLAPPSEIADPSWIKPGRASWSWWSHPDGPMTTELYERFLDYAAQHQWEYTLLDAGWWSADMPSLALRAKQRGVGMLLWTHAADFYDPGKRERKLDALRQSGAVGAKIDFWCSDRQETMEAMIATLRAAAERKLVVNLHGCTVPRGWHRTFPHLLTVEAVLGSESYMFDDRYPDKAAELNTILPFARNVAGPMDYTPLGLSRKLYPRKTTAAHELATTLMFTSGLIHFADQPAVYDSLPAEVQSLLKDAPAQWDETRCLLGEPGSAVVLARRTGDSWFIAGINGTAGPRPLALDLAPFAAHPSRTLLAEGEDPARQIRARSLAAAPRWEHVLPARGGFVLRLDRAPAAE